MKTRNLIALLLIGFVAGILFSNMYATIFNRSRYLFKRPEHKAEERNLPETAKSRPPKGTLVICDFESGGDLKHWERVSGSIELSDVFHTQGRYGAKILLKGGVEYPKVVLEDYFETKEGKGLSDWRGYEALRFDLYNPTENNEGIKLQIKGAKKVGYKRDIYLGPNEKTSVEVTMDELREIIDISGIRQFNLFRWNPGNDFTFYIDNIRVEKNEAGSAGKPEAAEKVGPAEKGFSIGIENNARKVFKEKDKFEGKWQNHVEISSARNEFEGFQIALYSPDKSLEDVKVEISDFIHKESGEKIKKDDIKWYLVDFVKTEKPNYTVPHVGWWPDPMAEVGSFDVKKEDLQPIWVSFYISEDTKAGLYEGKIKINPENDKEKTVDVALRVRDFSLPKRMHLKTAFDLYPWRLKVGHKELENLSGDEHNTALRNLTIKYYLKMLEYRISPILNLKYEDLAFTKELELYLENGLNAFAFGEYTGTHSTKWPKDDEKLNSLIPEYKQYANRLKKLGILDLSYIYTFDEPQVGDPFVAKVCGMVHQADPGLKNVVVLSGISNIKRHLDWFRDIDIVCVRNVGFSDYLAKNLKEMDKEIWMYVSGPSYPYPTLVIDFPGIMYRVLPWMAWKYDINGLLYWCANFWTKNPWDDPANTKWKQNGNGSLFYPGETGPVGSVRLEILRDGIEDYEYLYILNQKIEEVELKGLDSGNNEALNRARELLNVDDIAQSMADFTRNPELIYERRRDIAAQIEAIDDLLGAESSLSRREMTQVEENFSAAIAAVAGKSFGRFGQLTFELYRGGTFVNDVESGCMVQKSGSYRDVAIVRSTEPLPETYKITAVVGGIDYGLERVEWLDDDPDYKEGPKNENGCYLLAVTDEAPVGHHTNDWWHEHRKVCIDVDNNTWGTGMPHPVFMVYFDTDNKLVSFDGAEGEWQNKWRKAVTYEPDKWYKVEIEKTEYRYIMRIYDGEGNLLKEGMANLNDVWHGDGGHPDYLVIGDPHENYYQGSMRIKSISMPLRHCEDREYNCHCEEP